MLVIGRKIGTGVELIVAGTEPLVLNPGDRLGRVLITDIDNRTVRMGFELPRTIKVLRDELPEAESSAAPATAEPKPVQHGLKGFMGRERDSR